jgi:uncharacterized protein YjeT (DUF2065 family)
MAPQSFGERGWERHSINLSVGCEAPPADGPPPIHGPFCEFSCRLMSQRATPPRLSGQEAGDMRDLVAWMLGLGLAVNGLVMLGFPADWYATVPGVIDVGPFNAHFIRDIGVAYLVSGAALVWLAITPAARPAAQAGAAFLALHAVVHVWDAAAGREHVHQLLIDLPTVFLPPALAIWIAFVPAGRDATLAKGEAR